MSTDRDVLPHLPAFHAVMTHGSLSAAARALNLAHPTVRRHIELMEHALDTRLFTRAANGLTPTAMAHTLLPMAQAVHAQGRAFSRMAQAERGSLQGTVRITASRIVAQHILPRILADLRQTAPRITFEIAANDQAENLAQRAADVAIRFVRPQQLNLIAARLPDVQIGLFAVPALAAEQHKTPLPEMPMVLDDQANTIAPALTAAGLGTPAQVVLRCDDPLAQLAAVQAGLGAGICQVKLAAALGLVRVLPHVQHAIPAWLVVHEDQAQVARIRHVFDHLKTALPRAM